MPAAGDTVLFCMAPVQVEHVNRVRVGWLATGKKPAGYIEGTQMHVGSPVHLGELLPARVIRAREDELDVKVDLPGNDVMWIECVRRGEGPGQWRPR